MAMFDYCNLDRANRDLFKNHSGESGEQFITGHSERPLRVAVLAGGSSPERDVSLASGQQVLAALISAGYAAELFDPAKSPLSDLGGQRFDVCFIALHGGAGEDGRIQSQLQLLGLPYTGSGPGASRLAMYKAASKERFLDAGISTPPFVLLEAGDERHTQAARCQQLGYPLVVKPDSQGSSLGVSLVGHADELDDALTAAAKLDSFVMAERWIAGREFTVALLGRQPFPILEIVADDPIFSFASKYSSPSTSYIFDHGLSYREEAAIVEIAVAAADVLGTKGLSRVDLICDHTGQPWVLEVNTVPGLTARSLAPRAAAQAGYELPQLCELMLRDALALEAVR
jgi:D-alanine-D-alanine ligase